MSNIKYKHTSNVYMAKKWLSSLPDIIACDFEIASKYTKREKDLFKFRYENCNDKYEAIKLLQKIESNGLSHPSLTVPTHFVIAISEDFAYVFILKLEGIRRLIFEYITSTDKLQIYHNSLFDFRHIYYHTNTLPKHYVDTLLLAKSILNNANSAMDRVGLKELMAYEYGDWGLVKDEETLYSIENMYDERMLRYTATDGCATMKLYNDIMKDLTAWKI